MASSDINNFSSSSPHRLPTLSASEALQNLSSSPRKPISTGLRSLDAALQGRDPNSQNQGSPEGGVSRGEVTEIYGPPGIGKTALAMQISASVLHFGGSVVWVDASYRFVSSRLKDIVAGFHHAQSSSPHSEPPNPCLESFHHFITPTLPHLLALLTQPSSSFPPPETSLVVVDCISILFTLAFPGSKENTERQQAPVKKSDATQWASSRRWSVMGDFISKIGRLAATRNIAILLTSQATTRIRSETGAILHPAISGTAWDTGIGTRIVIFRDWMFKATDTSSSQGDFTPGARFAGIVKAKGVSYEGIGWVAAFRIDKNGLQELTADHAHLTRNASPVIPATSSKRKREEVADSESEEGEAASDQEFGWAGDETTLQAEKWLE